MMYMKMKSLILLLLVMVLMLAGCGNRHKDISKEEAREYTDLVKAACEQYGYSYSKYIVKPAGASIAFKLTNENDDVEIMVDIDEDEFGNENCYFDIFRDIKSVDDRVIGLEKHLPVIVKISERFYDELSEEYLKDFLYNEDIWEEPYETEYTLMYKTLDALQYSIHSDDTYAKDYKEGDPLVESFSVSIW